MTTELIRDISASFGVECPDVLTGFKYIAEQIANTPDKQFIVGGEESYGYLVGDFVRDKDAVSACCMIAEMAAVLADSGKTLYRQLQELYLQYGFYKESLLSITRKGQAGAAEIQQMMDNFRSNPPREINGSKVMKMMDYKNRVSTDLSDGATTPITLPKSDVLQFFTADGTKITVRPSGTEPKIKFYFGVKEELSDLQSFERTSQELDTKIEKVKASLKL